MCCVLDSDKSEGLKLMVSFSLYCYFFFFTNMAMFVWLLVKCVSERLVAVRLWESSSHVAVTL